MDNKRKGAVPMDKYIKCNYCDDTVQIESITYVNDEPLCSECNAKIGYMLQGK